MEEPYWQRKPEPPPTLKSQMVRLLVNLWGCILTVFLLMAAWAVLRNFVHGSSIID